MRELENALFRAALAARGPAVTARDLCLALGLAAPAPAQPLSARVLELVGASEGVASGELAEALGVPDGRRGNAVGYVRGLRVAA